MMSNDTKTAMKAAGAGKAQNVPFHHHLACVTVMFNTAIPGSEDKSANAMPVNVVYTTTGGAIDAAGLQQIGVMGQQEFLRAIPDAEAMGIEIFRTVINSISPLGIQSMYQFSGQGKQKAS